MAITDIDFRLRWFDHRHLAIFKNLSSNSISRVRLDSAMVPMYLASKTLGSTKACMVHMSTRNYSERLKMWSRAVPALWILETESLLFLKLTELMRQ